MFLIYIKYISCLKGYVLKNLIDVPLFSNSYRDEKHFCYIIVGEYLVIICIIQDSLNVSRTTHFFQSLWCCLSI